MFVMHPHRKCLEEKDLLFTPLEVSWRLLSTGTANTGRRRPQERKAGPGLPPSAGRSGRAEAAEVADIYRRANRDPPAGLPELRSGFGDQGAGGRAGASRPSETTGPARAARGNAHLRPWALPLNAAGVQAARRDHPRPSRGGGPTGAGRFWPTSRRRPTRTRGSSGRLPGSSDGAADDD